jgi:uncharacterized sulfatase
MLSEGGIRVPFLMYWKGKITPGRVYDQPVISLDVATTAAALAGLPRDPELDGVNLLPYVTGERQGAPHECLYWRWIAQSAVREGKWKYLRGGAREYLFDVAADPSEKQSLLRQHPEVAARLRTRLEGWAGTLSPPGLATGQMAETWERYFDHYLDGKTIPRPEPSAPGGNAAGGWIARNARVTVSGEGLQVAPSKGGRQKPFLACSRFKIPGPVAATIHLRSDRGGKAGFAWRLEGQKDFPSDQVVPFDVRASEDWQEMKIDLPAKGMLIHLRVLLPEGVTSIRRIRLDSADGKRTQQWNFAEK